MTSLNAVRLLVDSKAPSDLGRLRVCVHASSLANEIGIHAGDFSRLLDGHVLHALGELVKAIRPTLNEVMIVEIFGDDDVQHRHTERRICTRTQAKVPVGARRHPVDARVDTHELRAAAHHVDGGVTEQTVTVRRQRLLAPKNDELRKLEHGVVVAAGQAACIIHLGIRGAKDIRGTRNARNIARITRLSVAIVRSADRGMSIRGKHRAALATGSAHDKDRFRTVGLLVIVNLLGKQIKGFIPRDALPFVLATIFASTLHRIEHSIGVVNEVAHSQATHAKSTVRDGMVLITFDFHQFASIIHIGLDAATSRMASGRRPCASTGDGQSVFFEAPRLAQIGSALTFENLHALSSFLSSAFAISLRFAFQQVRSSPQAK